MKEPTKAELTNLLVDLVDTAKEMRDEVIGGTIKKSEELIGQSQSGGDVTIDQIGNAIAVLGTMTHAIDAYIGVVNGIQEGEKLNNPFDSLMDKIVVAKALAMDRIEKAKNESNRASIQNSK
jgi:hypothetical protein